MNSISKTGFSLIEVLVVTAIIAIVTVVVYGAFFDVRNAELLEKQTGIISAVLERARFMTLSSEEGSGYGVHLEEDQIVLFKGSVYDPATTTNQFESLVVPVLISNITLSGGGDDVVFERLTGATDNFGTITVSIPGIATSSIITIYETGLVETIK